MLIEGRQQYLNIGFIRQQLYSTCFCQTISSRDSKGQNTLRWVTSGVSYIWKITLHVEWILGFPPTPFILWLLELGNGGGIYIGGQLPSMLEHKSPTRLIGEWQRSRNVRKPISASNYIISNVRIVNDVTGCVFWLYRNSLKQWIVKFNTLGICIPLGSVIRLCGLIVSWLSDDVHMILNVKVK